MTERIRPENGPQDSEFKFAELQDRITSELQLADADLTERPGDEVMDVVRTRVEAIDHLLRAHTEAVLSGGHLPDVGTVQRMARQAYSMANVTDSPGSNTKRLRHITDPELIDAKVEEFVGWYEGLLERYQVE